MSDCQNEAKSKFERILTLYLRFITGEDLTLRKKNLTGGTTSSMTVSTIDSAKGATTDRKTVRVSGYHREELTSVVVGGSAFVIAGLAIKYIIST